MPKLSSAPDTLPSSLGLWIGWVKQADPNPRAGHGAQCNLTLCLQFFGGLHTPIQGLARLLSQNLTNILSWILMIMLCNHSELPTFHSLIIQLLPRNPHHLLLNSLLTLLIRNNPLLTLPGAPDPTQIRACQGMARQVTPDTNHTESRDCAKTLINHTDGEFLPSAQGMGRHVR